MRSESQFTLRVAPEAHIHGLRAVIESSVRGLQANDYTPAQIEGTLGTVLGVDTQLIADRIYFVAEPSHRKRLAGCGGWSKRKILFGADVGPAVNASCSTRQRCGEDSRHLCSSRVRAAGSWVADSRQRRRRGARWASAILRWGSTLSSVPLYRRQGYIEVDSIAVSLWNGEKLPVVKMVRRAE